MAGWGGVAIMVAIGLGFGVVSVILSLSLIIPECLNMNTECPDQSHGK